MSRVIILNNLIRFEPEKKNLSSKNAHVHISAPASYCFQLLIDKQGELVTHEELYQHAWRQFGMEATANTLYQNISVIRRGLDKCGLHDDIIRTMPRRGFILSPAVIIQHARAQDYVDAEEVDIAEQTATILNETNPHLAFNESYTDELNTNTDFTGENRHFSRLDLEKNSAEYFSESSYEQGGHDGKSTITGEQDDYQSDTKANNTGRGRKCRGDEFFFYPHKCELGWKSMLSVKRASNALLVFTTITLVSSILYLLIYLNFEPNLESIRYDYAVTYNNCNYYLQRDADNDKRTIDLIYGLSQSCHSHKYKYITKFLEGDMMSVISCSREMNYFSVNNCVSEYIVAVGND